MTIMTEAIEGEQRTEEESSWEEAAAAVDDGAGLILQSVNLNSETEMNEVYEALGITKIGPKSRLRAYIQRLQAQTQFQQQQQQQQQQIPSETLAAIGAMANDYLEKKGTIVLSHATSSEKNDLLDMLELVEEGASWPVKPDPARIPAFPPFQWLRGDEDTRENRTAYMVHLQQYLHLPDGFALADAQPDRSSLSVDLPGTEKRRRISGTTSVVVARISNVRNNALRNNGQALFELKTPKNMKRKDHNPQAVCKHIAASYLNRDCAVVSVLTDLGSSWTFYWFAEVGNDRRVGNVALYKLQLPDDEESAGLARYILESLLTSHAQAHCQQLFRTGFRFELYKT